MSELQNRTAVLPEERNLSYCVTLSDDGSQSKRSSKLEDFSDIMENATITWIDMKVDSQEEAVEIATKIGFSQEMIKQLLTRSASELRFQGGYYDFDNELGLIFPAIRVSDFNVMIKPLFVLLKKGLILTIRDKDVHIFRNLHRYAEIYLRKSPQNLLTVDSLTLMLIRILDENNERNFEQLQKIEEGSEDLTHNLRSDNTARVDIGDQIVQMKHALIFYLSGLWETSDTLNSLRYGDSNILSDDIQILEKISNLQREVRNQLSLAEHLSEVLASSLECLHSIYNNQLQEKNNLLQDRNNLLQEKNNLLQERNNKLQEYSNQLQEKNNELQENNNILQEKNNKLQDYSNQLQENNNMLQIHNNQMTEVNNKLTGFNNRITLLAGFLAIIGAGFVVPNTIATMLSQTNIFQFTPLDMGWYVSLILVSTVVTTLAIWWWMKSKGLLPGIRDNAEQFANGEEEDKIAASS